MTCKNMDGIGIIGGAAILLAYSCGPNIVVGAIGAVTTGTMAAASKVSKVFLETELETAKKYQPENIVKIKAKICDCDENIDHYLFNCERFAVSMIPIYGPFKALFGYSKIGC